MSGTNKSNVKQLFGIQISRYREVTGLTQKQFAEFSRSTDTYIGKVERGEVNIGIENMGKFAEAFGVMHYELANPKHPIPILEEMPKKLQRYVAKVLKEKAAQKEQPRQPLAHYLDQLLSGNFLSTPKTAAMIAAQLKESYGIDTTAGKVTALLTRPPRNETVRAIPPSEWGGVGNKYVLREK